MAVGMASLSSVGDAAIVQFTEKKTIDSPLVILAVNNVSINRQPQGENYIKINDSMKTLGTIPEHWTLNSTVTS